MATKVLYTVTNNIEFDNRISRMASVATGLGAIVTVAGRSKGRSYPSKKFPFSTRRFRLPVNKGPFFYFFYNLRLFVMLLFRQYDVIIANDLDTLVPVWLISKVRKKTKVIFDSHEYFTGVPELADRPFVRGIWKRVEQIILPGLEHVITVSHEIAEKYNMEYGINPVVVRNCSVSSDHIIPVDRRLILAENDRLICIIQGTGLNYGSGVEELVKAVERVEHVHLLIVGSGIIIPSIKKYVAACSAPEKFTFLPPMPWERMMSFTKASDIGFFLHKPDTPNPAMSMPNKVFEYFSAGCGMVVSPIPGVVRMVDEFGAGIVLKQVSVDELQRVVSELVTSPLEVARLKKNSSVAFTKENWDIEKEIVKELYIKIFKDES